MLLPQRWREAGQQGPPREVQRPGREAPGQREEGEGQSAGWGAARLRPLPKAESGHKPWSLGRLLPSGLPQTRNCCEAPPPLPLAEFHFKNPAARAR